MHKLFKDRGNVMGNVVGIGRNLLLRYRRRSSFKYSVVFHYQQIKKKKFNTQQNWKQNNWIETERLIFNTLWNTSQWKQEMGNQSKYSGFNLEINQYLALAVKILTFKEHEDYLVCKKTDLTQGLKHALGSNVTWNSLHLNPMFQ